MFRFLTRWWLLAGLCGTFLLGCESAARRPYADDPLLMNRKPALAKAAAASPGPLARNEPSPPTPPSTALASATVPEDIQPAPAPAAPTPAVAGVPNRSGPASGGGTDIPVRAGFGRTGMSGPPFPGTLATPDMAGAESPVVAVPVARTKPLPELPASPPIRRQVPETYGHAADYSWLQGVLDKHYQGQFGLRYCEPSVEDRWGGKATLADDPRLAQFHDGDLILVEGELVKDKTAADAWHHYPTYRIREIWLVQHGP